jgi:hypothetical protein
MPGIIERPALSVRKHRTSFRLEHPGLKVKRSGPASVPPRWDYDQAGPKVSTRTILVALFFKRIVI